MQVVAGSSSPLLAKRIADKMGAEILNTVLKRFPDGELYVRVENAGRDVVVVQSITSNDDLVYLMLLLDALEGSNITAVIPYMGYARQDKKFKDGEAISIRAVAKLIESYAERVITVNIHSDRAKGYFRNLLDLDAMPIIGRYYRNRDIVMISPDLGSYERVRVASEFAGCEFDYLEKERIDAETVEIKPKRLEVAGRDVVIVDDIISTGGTMIEATKMLLKSGARSVECACVHAVLAENALNRLYSAGVKSVIATDTIEKSISRISVADLIVDALKSD